MSNAPPWVTPSHLSVALDVPSVACNNNSVQQQQQLKVKQAPDVESNTNIPEYLQDYWLVLNALFQ